jgi:cobalt-zinc-cadmium efflux system outer membrane protein
MMKIHAWAPRFFLSISMLVNISPAIAAQEIMLSLDQAVKLAIEQNLELKAKREELGLAEGRLIRSNLFLQHNPELEGDLSNRRLKKPEEGFPKNLTQGGVALTQEFEIAGQPAYRREAAGRNLEKVNFEVSDFERTLRFRVTENFLKLLNLQAKITQAEQIVDLRTRLRDASKRRLELGDIPEVQHLLAEFELNRTQSDLISLRREREEALLSLRQNLALEPESGVAILGDLDYKPQTLSAAELVKAALERRPDLAALDREKRVAEAEENLNRAERIPNVKFGIFWERDDRDNIVGGRVSIPIPFFDRKQGEIREAQARKSQANINYVNSRQTIERSVQTAYQKFRLSEREISLYPAEARKQFDNSLELYLKAYQERLIDLPDLIVFQNQVVEARQKYIDALTNYNLSLAELKFHAGME